MMQKYRVDCVDPATENGSRAAYANWIGGPSLALVRNCPTPFGPRTVYVRGEADTMFSIPAACSFRRRAIKGYLASDNGRGWIFHPYLYGDTVFPTI